MKYSQNNTLNLLFNNSLIFIHSRFDTSMGAWGPLVDGPDYTFLDGRPTPLRSGQRRRAKQQKEVSVSYKILCIHAQMPP